MKAPQPLRPLWALIAVVVFVFMLLTIPRPSSGEDAPAPRTLATFSAKALLLSSTKSLESILGRYTSRSTPVRILIVPGHNSESSGAYAYNTPEANLVANMGERLEALLKQDARVSVTLLRDTKGYREPFASFLTTRANDIATFRENIRRDYAQLMLEGKIPFPSYSPPHGEAKLADALKLHGANLFAYENDADIVIHLHLNDYAGRKTNAGKYTGYAIYYAGPPLTNAQVSGKLAGAIANRIEKIRTSSNFPSEISGLVPDPELLALGAHGSVDAAAVLVEYGYMSERVFSRAETKNTMADLVAYETARGIEDFLGSKSVITPPESLAASPVRLPSVTPSASALTLQYTLLTQGLYPPSGKSLADCPLTGTVGPCTKTAYRAYTQKMARSKTSPLVE